MPFLFLGFVFVTLLWLLWAIAWVVVWAFALLLWPIAVVLGAFALIRAMTRSSLRLAEAPSGRASPTRYGAFHNSAFDDYRQETLRRLDEEQGRFREFLERLRRSKDREEFDRFVAERRASSDQFCSELACGLIKLRRKRVGTRAVRPRSSAIPTTDAVILGFMPRTQLSTCSLSQSCLRQRTDWREDRAARWILGTSPRMTLRAILKRNVGISGSSCRS